MAYENWTQEQLDVAAELGEDTIIKRAGELPGYQRYETVYSPNNYDRVFTPDQMIALAKFAHSLGSGYLIHNGAIQILKDIDEQALTVVKNEIYRRAQEARERADHEAR